MSNIPTDFFTKEMAEAYDQRNSRLAPISLNLHFLMSLVLERLPEDSKVLSVGAGTGAEILSLAKTFPHWSFLASDPSLSMLKVCRSRIKDAGLEDRCEFIHGYVSDVPSYDFDAAFAVLVAHFIKREERQKFYEDMLVRLKKKGLMISAEISFDLESKEFPLMLSNWETVQKMMGGTPESIGKLPLQLREVLTVLPPNEVESIMRASGIPLPIKFFQSFMISAWYGEKV